MCAMPLQFVDVLYDFDYVTEDGRNVCIKEGEGFLLLNKTNGDWWQVIRDGEKHPFFAPANYLRPVSPVDWEKDVNANIESPNEKLYSNASGESLGRSKNAGLMFCNPLCSMEFAEKDTSQLTDEDSLGDDCSQSYDSLLEDISDKSKLDIVNYEKPAYANLPLPRKSDTPPIPSGELGPLRELPDHWNQYIDGCGRKYYYNMATKEIRWKPPRKLSSNEFQGDSLNGSLEKSTKRYGKTFTKQESKAITSSLESIDGLPSTPTVSQPIILPRGYKWCKNSENQEPYILNKTTKLKWYLSSDEMGRVYFFDETSTVSLWELPDATPTEDSRSSSSQERLDSPNLSKSRLKQHPLNQSSPQGTLKVEKPQNSPPAVEMNAFPWPSLNDDQLVIARKGTLNRTKLLDSGRKVRKNWSSAYVILTDVFLLLYKDVRTAHVNAVGNKPDMCVDLNGSQIEWSPSKSSRKNVFMITTLLGQKLLLQDDNAQTSKEWFESIRCAMQNLPSKSLVQPEKSDNKKCSKLDRTKSTKVKPTKANEELLTSSPSESKKRIRDRLKQFFLRRPTLESLKEKGIFKDEPVFGCHLSTLCSTEKTKVPNFVVKCIEAIEKKEMNADGLYRISGNLSQIQKIRLHVNQDNYSCLETEDDVYVLTGSLKMFFRSLKEPLFPFDMFDKFVRGIASPDREGKINCLKPLIRDLPEENRDILRYLLQHLLRVSKYEQENRMDIKNLAIVFGPTLMWPQENSANIALNMMLQSHLVEFLLLEFDELFG